MNKLPDTFDFPRCAVRLYDRMIELAEQGSRVIYLVDEETVDCDLSNREKCYYEGSIWITTMRTDRARMKAKESIENKP